MTDGIPHSLYTIVQQDLVLPGCIRTKRQTTRFDNGESETKLDGEYGIGKAIFEEKIRRG